VLSHLELNVSHTHTHTQYSFYTYSTKNEIFFRIARLRNLWNVRSSEYDAL